MLSLERLASCSALLLFAIVAGAIAGAACPDSGANPNSMCPCGPLVFCEPAGTSCTSPSARWKSVQNGAFSCQYEKDSQCVDMTAEEAGPGGKCYEKVDCNSVPQDCVPGQSSQWVYWSPLKKSKACAPKI